MVPRESLVVMKQLNYMDLLYFAFTLYLGSTISSAPV